MKIGYARVSTEDQSLDLQEDALQKEGCIRIFSDKVSSVKQSRPGLIAALDYLREGDTLVVWKLDRLGRTTRQLLETIEDLKAKKIEFKSLTESIDTNAAFGKFIFHLFSSLAELERSNIIERTRAGLVAARARGRMGGRPRKMDDKKIMIARQLQADPSISIDEICKMLDIKKSTLYAVLQKSC